MLSKLIKLSILNSTRNQEGVYIEPLSYYSGEMELFQVFIEDFYLQFYFYKIGKH